MIMVRYYLVYFKIFFVAIYLIGFILDLLKQGSQTQIDSGAASDSKKSFAGRMEKSENNYL